MKRRVHVFASDLLPLPGCPRTAGGNRSQQVISALRRAGHQVTYSMPLETFLGKKYAGQLVDQMTPDELWACQHFFEHEVVLNRIQPEIAVYCNVNCFRTVKRFAREIVHVLDLYGPLQFEGLLLDEPDFEAAAGDGGRLEARCLELVEKIRQVDHLVTVSERQKYFWSAYCSLAGFSFRDLNVLVCPVSFEAPQVARRTAPHMTVVYSGGFYPWQKPDASLRAAAECLSRIPGAVLHIFGSPHAGTPNEVEVRRMLAELSRMPCVRYHGYRPVEELADTLAQAWCALELMERNLERELAITGRTVEFLSTGTPVIYNDYSSLSELIRRYGAGWTISPDDPAALRSVFAELQAGGPALVEEKSGRARALAAQEFSAERSMAALLDICEKPAAKRPSMRERRSGGGDLGRVLIISHDPDALLKTRLGNPLATLEERQLIQGYTRFSCNPEEFRSDQDRYDVVIIQRAVPEVFYLALSQLGVPYLMDVDDNLLARATYRTEAPEPELIPGLNQAAGVTVPNPRLLGLLERYTGFRLAHKTFVAPNSLPFPGEEYDRAPAPPRQMLWIQSDTAALTEHREEVFRAADEFSSRHQLPVVLIGRNVLGKTGFRTQNALGKLSLKELLEYLASCPVSLGLAPLETTADQETLDFIGGKSDLKIAMFAGFGHPVVGSAAPPYTDSPLRGCARLTGNRYADWMEALEYQFCEGWRHAAETAREIREERNCARVALESWLPALEANALPRPVTGRAIYEAVSSLDGKAPVDWSTYGAAPDRNGRSALLHRHMQLKVEALEREVRSLRTSYSWKITAPLRKLVKPLME